MQSQVAVVAAVVGRNFSCANKAELKFGPTRYSLRMQRSREPFGRLRDARSGRHHVAAGQHDDAVVARRRASTARRLPCVEVRRGLIVRAQLDDDLRRDARAAARSSPAPTRASMSPKTSSPPATSSMSCRKPTPPLAYRFRSVPGSRPNTSSVRGRGRPADRRADRRERRARCAVTTRCAPSVSPVARAQRRQRRQDVGEPAVHVAEQRDAARARAAARGRAACRRRRPDPAAATGCARRRDRAARRRAASGRTSGGSWS